MLFRGLLAASLALVGVNAAPSKIIDSGLVDGKPINDTVLLNYALNIQVLEHSAYVTFVENYSRETWVSQGLPTWGYSRLLETVAHEQEHIDALKAVLGKDARQKECKYLWPYKSAPEFIFLMQITEGIIAGAMIDILPKFKDPKYTPLIGQLIATESRHAAWNGGAVGGALAPGKVGFPWSGAWETPLTFDQYFTALDQHIDYCPRDNMKFPFVRVFEDLRSTPYCHGCFLNAGDQVQLNFTEIAGFKPPYYAAFQAGLEPIIVPITEGNITEIPEPNTKGVFTGYTTIPKDVKGDVYIHVTTSATDPKDENMVAGAFIFQVAFGNEVDDSPAPGGDQDDTTPPPSKGKFEGIMCNPLILLFGALSLVILSVVATSRGWVGAVQQKITGNKKGYFHLGGENDS